mgnify:CR=1 FL=1
MTLDPTASAHIFKKNTWAPDWGWREGEAVEALKHHSTLCARGKAWTARAGDHRWKAWGIKRKRKNHGREGRSNLKKGRERWPIKWKRKNPRKKSQKRAKRAFEIFPRVLPSPLYWPPLRPFFRFGRPSLPWFFLSLFIHHFFLVTSSALAVQALPQAHDMKWFLKDSTIFPSLSNRSRSLKLTFKDFWNYFEPILNLFWINVIFLWNDHVLIILN